MSNFKKWDERFPIIKNGKGKKYWVLPVRKRLGSRTTILDPKQINLFD